MLWLPLPTPPRGGDGCSASPFRRVFRPAASAVASVAGLLCVLSFLLSSRNSVRCLVHRGFIRNGTLFVSLITVTLVLNLTFYVREVVCLSLSRVGTEGFATSVTTLLSRNRISGTGRGTHGAINPITDVYCRKLLQLRRAISSVSHDVRSCTGMRISLLRGKST